MNSQHNAPFIGDESPVLYAESIGFDVVYLPFGKVAHFARWSTMGGVDKSGLCHAHPRWPWTWYGTGNQAEIDKAESLPLCSHCLKRLAELKLSETSLRVGDDT